MPAVSNLARRLLRRCLATGLVLAALAGRAAADETGFTGSLTPAEQQAMGLATLSAEQRTALDTQVWREISLARQGDVTAFAKSFTQRRTDEQAAAAGLGTLSADERAQLDRLVAAAVARPPPVWLMPTWPTAIRVDDAVVTAPRKIELHGELTLTAGAASGGRSFYGASATTRFDDPKHNFSASFTYSEYHGKGMYFGGPDYLDGVPWRR